MVDPRPKLRGFALGLPDTREAFPWSESVGYRIVAPKRLVAELDARG